MTDRRRRRESKKPPHTLPQFIKTDTTTVTPSTENKRERLTQPKRFVWQDYCTFCAYYRTAKWIHAVRMAHGRTLQPHTLSIFRRQFGTCPMAMQLACSGAALHRTLFVKANVGRPRFAINATVMALTGAYRHFARCDQLWYRHSYKTSNALINGMRQLVLTTLAHCARFNLSRSALCKNHERSNYDWQSRNQTELNGCNRLTATHPRTYSPFTVPSSTAPICSLNLINAQMQSAKTSKPCNFFRATFCTKPPTQMAR